MLLLYKIRAMKLREGEYAELVRRSDSREKTHETRYRELLDNSSDIVYTHDLDGKLITWSKAGELITGYSQRELFQKNLADLIPPDSRKEFSEHLREIAAGRGAAAFELAIVAKNGSPVTLDVSTRPITQEGKAIGTLGFARDVTARRRSEEEAHRARQAAEAASRAKSEFLANVSHEIRTPMNCILGMTELALETSLNADQREYLDMVKTSAHSLLTVINDVLDFSKVEAGKLELDLTPFSVKE
ncbi:MAG: PAS domain S-box protein, partial [Terriglobia bacterium]